MNESEKPPLDQQNRDWTKGNCYYVALEAIKDLPQLMSMGLFPNTDNFCLVHGTFTKGELPHAWVEYDNAVLDNANNNRIHMAKDEYYKQYYAKPVKLFTREQADAILQATEEPDGSFGNMNWSAYADEEIKQCIEAYDQSTSPFTRDVEFSDPSNPANRDQLQLKQ